MLMFWCILFHVGESLIKYVPLRDNVRFPQDIDVYSFSNVDQSVVVYPPLNGTIQSSDKQFVAYYALINKNENVTFELPDLECSIRQVTSKTASEHSCVFAINGGFFSFSAPYCLPEIRSDGHNVNIVYGNPTHPSISIDVETKQVSVGFLELTQDNIGDYDNVLTGVGWIVRNGTSYVSKSEDLDINSSFVTESAPRTGLGIYKNGTMIMLTVDGQENINYGLNLFEFAELFTYLNVDSVINLDGGGSTTAVYNGNVYNKPTCNDNATICQRDVTSIVCAK